MNKITLSANGVLTYEIQTWSAYEEDIEHLFAVLAYFTKAITERLAEDGMRSHMEPYDAYLALTDSFQSHTELPPLSDESVEALFDGDIQWMAGETQDDYSNGIHSFLDTFLSGYWTEPDLSFLFYKNTHDETFGLRVETTGTLVKWRENSLLHEYEELPFEVTNEVVRPGRITYLEPSDTQNDPVNQSKPAPRKKQAVQAQPEPIQPKKQTIAQSDKLEGLVNGFMEEIIKKANLPYPLTMKEWQEVKDVIKGAIFITGYDKQDIEEWRPTSKEIAHALYNQEGSTQILATMYLLTKTLHTVQKGGRVAYLHEVTALIRYFDWLEFDENSKTKEQVYDTILNMTTALLSGR